MTLKTYLANKLSSERFRVNGLIRSNNLPRKQRLCQSFRDHIVYRAEQLPPKVDLRPDMTPVEDQSRLGSCAANCLAGAYEYLTKKATGRNIDVSRLFVYYNARVKDQNSRNVIDSGCTMTSAIESLEEYGTCLESVWPYDISRVNTRPSNAAYEEAQRHKITEALRVDINLYEMKACLAQGFPFAFGLQLFGSFDQAGRTGVVPMPNYWDAARQSHASHALLAVGYSDQSRAFIVRNSWGDRWGDHGYCYIPYDYMTNPKYCFDVWAIRQIATDNFSRDGWHVTDPINYLDNKTAPYVNPTPYYDQGDIVQDEDDTETDYRQYDYNDGWNDDYGRNDRYDDQRDTDTYDEGSTTEDDYYSNPYRQQQNDYYSRSSYDQFRAQNKHHQNNNYQGGYRNNGGYAYPFSPNGFSPSPYGFPAAGYGSSYGYSNPMNNGWNRFFY